MKYTFTLLCACFIVFGYAQDAQVLKGALPMRKVINLSDKTAQDWNTNLQTGEEPRHTEELGPIKAQLAALHRRLSGMRKESTLRSQAAVLPVLADSFQGNAHQNPSPCDNTMAISNSGVIVSCVNCQMTVLDTLGNVLTYKSLSYFSNQLGIYTSISDPRVIYDPVADRFVLLFFNGSLSTTSQIVVAFSQTNDPAASWYFYQLSGNLLHDTTWSDYPVVSLTNDDFFVTFNHLQDSFYFPYGFRYSVVWQIDKQSAYNGDTIHYNYWHNINYQNKPIWNICTVQGGSGLTGPNAFFLSVRPGAANNDTVFLHEISDSYLSGTAQFTTQMLTTNTPYGVAPDAPQQDGQVLATNDARILSAIIQNDKIQYVQNSVDPAYASAGVYVGTISSASATPVATGQILGYDTIGLGYPSIAYVGNGSDNRAIVTCSYLPAHGYPGTAAFYIDNAGQLSGLLYIKEGVSTLHALQDTVQRWGDYTGIQKMYNEPNTVWLSGSYTNSLHLYQTCIAKLVNTDSAATTGIGTVAGQPASRLYPNPAQDVVTLQFDMDNDAWCRVALTDASGREIRLLLEDNISAGANQFSFSTAYLTTGTYILNITSGSKNILSKAVVVQR